MKIVYLWRLNNECIVPLNYYTRYIQPHKVLFASLPSDSNKFLRSKLQIRWNSNYLCLLLEKFKWSTSAGLII